MIGRRLVAYAFAACLAVPAAVAAAYSAFWRAVDGFVTVFLEALGAPRVSFAGYGDRAPAAMLERYESPPQHSLRHEAGTSRRGAHRNI